MAETRYRPLVYTNMAITADGKITSARREHPRFTSETDRKTMDRLRAEADAVLVGAGTIRADNPILAVRDPEMQAYRTSLGKPAGLVTVIVSASGRIDPEARVLRADAESTKILATVEEAPAGRIDPLARVAEIWRLGRGEVSLPALLARLQDRGVERLLVEGGAELNWAFVAADLVDEMYVTIAPVVLGGATAPGMVGGAGLPMARQRRLHLLSVDQRGDELYCHYRVVHPE